MVKSFASRAKKGRDGPHILQELFETISPTKACDTCYLADHPTVPMQADKVSLPDEAATATLADLLNPEDRELLLGFNALLLEPYSSNAGRAFDRSVPNRQEWVKLVLRLRDIGLVELHRQVKIVNDFFCIAKDEDSQRFIVNAKEANAVFGDPPRTRLPTPDLLAKLEVDANVPVFSDKDDVCNAFHRVRMPAFLQKFFGLPFVYAGEVGRHDLPPRTKLYPACVCLPMGWSFSAYFMQAAHEFVCYNFTNYKREDAILPGMTDFSLRRPRHGVYLDDKFAFNPDRMKGLSDQKVYEAAMRKVGLIPKISKVILPTLEPTEILGYEFNGLHHTFGLAPLRRRKLMEVTYAFLQRGTMSGDQLLSLVGRWTWAILCRRLAFSVFSAVYAFAQQFKGKTAVAIWPSVELELRTIADLAPLLEVRLSTPWSARTVAYDASSLGEGVVFTALSPSEVATYAARPHPFKDTTVPDRTVHTIPPGVQWTTLIAHQWRYSEHVNILEARSLLAGTRWLASQPALAGLKVLLWGDSSVVTSAAKKGRSSAPSINYQLRQMAAISFKHGLIPHVNWIPTDVNPADPPSRGIPNFGLRFGKAFSSDDCGDGPSSFTRLAAFNVGPKTRKAYKDASDLFRYWLKHNQRKPSCLPQLDLAFRDWVEELQDHHNGHRRQTAVNALYGLFILAPRAEGQMFATRKALAGWKKKTPVEHFLPMPRTVMIAVAATMAVTGNYPLAMATLVAFDTLARNSTIMHVCRRDIALPGDPRLASHIKDVTVSLRRTKRDRNTHAVAISDPDTAKLLTEFVNNLPVDMADDVPIFGKPHVFIKTFKETVRCLGLDSRFVPHCLRAGGATFLSTSGCSPEFIQLRGQWRNLATAMIYIRAGVSQLLHLSTPRPLLLLGQRFEKDLLKVFSLALVM